MKKEINSIKSGFDLDAFELPKQDKRQNQKKIQAPPKKDVDPKKIIQLIFKKMKRNDSFHSFSNQINEVNKILQMKYASANDIAQAILNDVPLTSKLLKLVNSSYYAHFSADGISTITEAMIIVGTDQIKFLAASLKLIELMQNLGDSNILKEKTLKSLQRGIIAGQIAKEGGIVSSEKLQVSSILYDFGEYLVTAFAPATYKKVNAYKEQHQIDLDVASKAVMGISYKNLSLLVANKWNMPKTVTNSMKPVTNYDVKKSDMAPEDFLPFVCSFANDLCDINLGDGKQDIENKLSKIKNLYSKLFSIPTDTLVEIVAFSEEKIAQHASVLNISPPTKIKITTCIKDENLIKNGIDQIKQKLETNFKVQDIFESALQYLCDGFKFTNINFCIKNKQQDTMNARYVLGPEKDTFLNNFKFKIMKSGDLFNQSLHNESIIIVDNIETSHYKTQIPLWFKENRFSDAFAVVPIGLDNKIVSMLYLDWKPDQVSLCEKTKAYLEIFKGLIVEALKKKR